MCWTQRINFSEEYLSESKFAWRSVSLHTFPSPGLTQCGLLLTDSIAVTECRTDCLFGAVKVAEHGITRLQRLLIISCKQNMRRQEKWHPPTWRQRLQGSKLWWFWKPWITWMLWNVAWEEFSCISEKSWATAKIQWITAMTKQILERRSQRFDGVSYQIENFRLFCVHC